MWSWQSFVDQSSERRGPGTEAEQPVKNVCKWRAELKSVRNWMKCAELDKRENWRPIGCQNNKEFTRRVFSLPWITYGIQYSVGLPRS